MASDVSSVKQCPICKSDNATVIEAEGWIITVICPNEHKWKTLSKRCHVCKQPNGFLYEGTCLNCYTKGNHFYVNDNINTNVNVVADS